MCSPGSRSRSKTAQDMSGLSGFPARFERFEGFEIHFHLWIKHLFCYFHTLTFALWNCMKEYDKHFFHNENYMISIFCQPVRSTTQTRIKKYYLYKFTHVELVFYFLDKFLITFWIQLCFSMFVFISNPLKFNINIFCCSRRNEENAKFWKNN